MRNEPIRIGIVGAGNVVRQRYIAGFRAWEGVEVVSLCNSRRASSERVAAEYEIPQTYDTWLESVEAEDTNAILIGTYADLHCPVTLATLEHEKHVLTENPVGRDAQEAHAMLEAARARPDLVAQAIPSGFSYQVEPTVQELIRDGYLGELLAIDMRLHQRSFIDLEGRFSRRNSWEVRGYNAFLLTGWYDCLMRWVGPATKVTAMSKVGVPFRKDESGILRAITTPEHLEILCQMACGAQCHILFSSLTGIAPPAEVWLFRSQGTLRMEIHGRPPLAGRVSLFGGRRGERELTEIPIPPEKEATLQVEEEFVGTIRGLKPNTLSSLEAGVQYMEFAEAVVRSAQIGEAVELPL